MRLAGGFASVTSIDFSEEVVAAMRSKTQTMGCHLSQPVFLLNVPPIHGFLDLCDIAATSIQ